ncbi:hypothetical protein BSL78_24271 [Apostichopus japonicus]|uniref:EamA domain-containing protein n=1 Tax=Stichopus japonicus TaxID=307972 RepID=A0A2G8JT81_STIJA|nr:hypothetical protein BSL78_24271 [Apostichopus japonicus]
MENMESDNYNDNSGKKTGILLAAITTLLYSITDLTVYAASRRSNQFVVYVFNSTVGCVLCIFYIIIKRPTIECNFNQTVLATTVIGSLQTLSQFTILFAAIQIGPGNAMALYHTMPVFAIALHALIIGDAIKKFHVILAIVAFAGALLISRSYLLGEDWQAPESIPFWDIITISSALLSALSQASVVTLRRKWSHFNIDPCFTTFSFLFQFSLISIILWAVNKWFWPDSYTDAVMLITSSLATFLASLSLHKSASLCDPPVVTLVLTFGVVITYAGQIAFFSLPLTWYSLVGAAFIFVSGVGNALFTIYEERIPNLVNGNDSKVGEERTSLVNE